MIRGTITQLLFLVRHTDKKWLVPILLLLVIVALLVVAAQVSPVPVFIYPFV